jgi:hypothetical protein
MYIFEYVISGGEQTDEIEIWEGISIAEAYIHR